MSEGDIETRAKALMDRLDKEAEKFGYHLNPDIEMTFDLCRGLIQNEDRYGYIACPCRLADGDKQADLDMICPCDYRDTDIEKFGSCFCALYVNEEIKKGKAKAQSIPDRRPMPEERQKPSEQKSDGDIKVWRCRVCGYLCGREEPPGVCPICKAKKDRFEEFEL